MLERLKKSHEFIKSSLFDELTQVGHTFDLALWNSQNEAIENYTACRCIPQALLPKAYT